MSKQYDEYLFNHIQAVKACMLMLCDEYELTSHDMSKFSEEEYYAYDNYFYPDENGIDDSDKEYTKKLFEYAWLNHQNTNRHHWQYWVLINDEDGIKPLSMPVMDICEMVADWGSFAYQKKDGSELIKWYESHKDKMILHEQTRKYVEELVPKMASAIDYHFREGMPLIEKVKNIYKSMEKIHEDLAFLKDGISSLWGESDDCLDYQLKNLDICLNYLVTACNEYDRAMDYFEYYKEECQEENNE